MSDILQKIKGGLIVSCQSEGEDPFNANPDYLALFALAALQGGAIGIRSEGIHKISSIKKIVNLPIIGLIKSQFPDGFVRITGSFNEVKNLISIGCDIVAVDGTFRKRENGLTGPDFISEIKKRFNCIILADISTFDEAVACATMGADCVSTTLSGYTPNTINRCTNLPDLQLLRKVTKNIDIPVFAEGRYNTPALAKEAMSIGAYSVIVGSAITRPRVITSWFVSEINNASKE